MNNTDYNVKVNRNSGNVHYTIYEENRNIQVKFTKDESVISVTRVFNTSGELDHTIFIEYVFNDYLKIYGIKGDDELFLFEYVDVEYGRLLFYDNRGYFKHVTSYLDLDREVNHKVTFYPNSSVVEQCTFRYMNEYNNIEALITVYRPSSDNYKVTSIRWNLLYYDVLESIDDSLITYIDGIPFYVKDIDLNADGNEIDIFDLDILDLSSDYFTEDMINDELDYISDNLISWYKEYGITVSENSLLRYYTSGNELQEFDIDQSKLQD